MNKKREKSRLYRTKTIRDYQEQLNFLGSNSKISAIYYLNLRLISSIILFFMLLYIVEWGYYIAPIVTLGYYFFFPRWTIQRKVKERSRRLEKEAMYFFEILTLSLKTGKNFTGAIEMTCRMAEGELAKEFCLVLQEIRFGKSLEEALRDLKRRIPSDAVQNMILNMIEAHVDGVRIVESLEQQVAYLREKRIFGIKEKMNQIPTRISIISVLFFVPLMLLLILSPAIIELILG